METEDREIHYISLVENYTDGYDGGMMRLYFDEGKRRYFLCRWDERKMPSYKRLCRLVDGADPSVWPEAIGQQIYEHFKGNIYLTFGAAPLLGGGDRDNGSDKDSYVIYFSPEHEGLTPLLYVREREEFLGLVKPEGSETEVPRFKPLPTPQYGNGS